MLGVFAEFETNLRRKRQLEGIKAAKARSIGCARMRSVLISNKGDRPWTRLAGLEWTRRSMFSSFTG